MQLENEGIDRLIGQTFLIGLPGQEVDPGFRAHYSRCPAGGFILFRRNVRDRAQVSRLTSALVRLASSAHPAGGPPIIAIDQEGGTLSPLRGLVTPCPGGMGLAATNDTGLARRVGRTVGRDLLSLGINTNLAPVLDLAREPLNPAVGPRAFSDDPHVVAEFGVSFARGLLDAGALFVAKHFPGHGSVVEDSHLALPECTLPLADLVAQDVSPFAEVARLPQAAVMVGHIKVASLDSVRPASMSQAVVNGLLRRDIGFDGVVMTDCLEMVGARTAADVPEAAVVAMEAGCDVILVSHTPELQVAAFEAVRSAVLSGRLSVARVQESAARVRQWKSRLGSKPTGQATNPAQPAQTDEAGEPGPAERELARDDLGERVVTLVSGDPSRAWRPGPGPLILVVPAMDRITLSEDAADISPLIEELGNQGICAATVACSSDPGPEEIRGIASCVAQRCAGDPGARVALVVRNNAAGARGLPALAAAIEEERALLLVGVRDPRETRAVQAALCRQAPAVFTYSTDDIVLRALARVLAGKASAKGVVPVRMW